LGEQGELLQRVKWKELRREKEEERKGVGRRTMKKPQSKKRHFVKLDTRKKPEKRMGTTAE